MHAQETKTTFNQHTRSHKAHAKLKTSDTFEQYTHQRKITLKTTALVKYMYKTRR